MPVLVIGPAVVVEVEIEVEPVTVDVFSMVVETVPDDVVRFDGNDEVECAVEFSNVETSLFTANGE